jgi:hypothetical protein
VRAAQRRDLREHLRQRRQRAHHHRVEWRLGLQAFRARVHRRHVGESQRMRRMGNEADFLGGGVDEGELPRGVAQRQRQARKPRSGTHVCNARALQVGMNGEAVEQVMREHRGGGGDRRQVVSAVPARELIEQRQQAPGVAVAQNDSQGCRVLHQTFDGTQSSSLRDRSRD